MFVYCLNNPINLKDLDGKTAESSLLGWTTSMWWLAAIDGPLPIGDIVFATGVLLFAVGIICSIDTYENAGITYYSTNKTNISDPDPYARPNQKKQGRENKNKNRKKRNFTSRNNRRDGKPAPPKRHTPGHDHQKFSRAQKAKLNMVYKRIG